MILGTASGVLGDVVMSRRDGVQQQRIRVRKIANPKTQSQAEQRSVIAPVTKFFSPLTVTLERSWQGMNRAKSYNAFLKFNTKLAQENEWALPKGCSWFPLPYRLSHGTIPGIPQTLTDDEGGVILNVTGMTINGQIGANSPSMFAQSMIAAGYEVGDQITIIFADWLHDDDLYAQGNFKPRVARFYLRPDSGKTWAQMGLSVSPSSDFSQWSFNRSNCAGAAMIVSRYRRGIWQRSTCNMMVVESIMSRIETPSEKQANINTYRPVNLAPASDIFLNGSTSAPAGIRLFTEAGQSYYVVSIYKHNGWAYAVTDDNKTFFCYCNDEQSRTNGKCLTDDGHWETNPNKNAANSVITNFAANNNDSETLLLFFLNYGFTYAQLMGY